MFPVIDTLAVSSKLYASHFTGVLVFRVKATSSVVKVVFDGDMTVIDAGVFAGTQYAV